MRVFGHDGRAKNMIRIMINSARVVRRLARVRCRVGHGHLPIVGFKVRRCQVYFETFCEDACFAITGGVAARPGSNDPAMGEFIVAMCGDMSQHPHDEVDDSLICTMAKEFHGDIIGKRLGKDSAVKAGTAEIDGSKWVRDCTEVFRNDAKVVEMHDYF